MTSPSSEPWTRSMLVSVSVRVRGPKEPWPRVTSEVA